MERKIINQYLMIAFLFGLAFSFFCATYVVFLVSKGLDLLQVNLVNVFFMVGVFVLEIPTGVYADLFGRKKSFVLACFLLSLASFVYYLSESFWMFVSAELIAALAMAFLSGSLEAWIVDSLKHYGFESDLNSVFKKEQQLHQIGTIIGAMIGGYLGTIDLSLPWLCSSIGMFFLGLISIILIKEEYHFNYSTRLEMKAIQKIIQESIKYGIQYKPIFYLICFSTIFMFICQGINMYWQIMFKNSFSLNTDKLGWIFFGMSISIIIGNHLSSWFLRVFQSDKKALIVSQIITAVGIIIASQLTGLTIVLFGFFFHEIGRGVFKPLEKTYLNHRIPSEQRATIISFKSMITKIGNISGLIISGYIAEEFSISAAWLVSAIILIISILIFLKISNSE